MTGNNLVLLSAAAAAAVAGIGVSADKILAAGICGNLIMIGNRIHAKGSKVNFAYCWIEYKKEHPGGYEQSQFYEYYNRFVETHYGKRDTTMVVERVPGE